jgi:hypothetical protein
MITSWGEFMKAVELMRLAQKEYQRIGSTECFKAAHTKEQQVDSAIETIKALREKSAQQTTGDNYGKA